MKNFFARIERLLAALAVVGYRRPFVALGVALVLAAAGGLLSSRIELRADLTELLPESFESVQGLEELKERFGGIGYVVVVGRDAEPEALRRFADDLAPQLAALPDVRFVDHLRTSEFFKERALYYLELDDLREVQSRIREREKWERRKRNPMYVQLDDEPAPELDFSDIREKYAGSGSSAELAGDAGDETHYLDEEEQIVALLVKPASTSADLGFSKKIVGQVEELLSKQDLGKYGADFRVELTGTFKKKLDQQEQILGDVATASSLALLLMLGYLLFHFRGAVAMAVGLLPVGLGLALTYGFVGVAYGSVNLLTAFLGAILGGLGVEHGIHLIGRYQALRLEGRPPEGAVQEAFTHTGGAALVSSAVAAFTFLSIGVSEFRAFREFGVIAAVGMFALIAAYFLVLPAALALTVRLGIEPRGRFRPSSEGGFFGARLLRSHRRIAVVGGALLVFMMVASFAVRFDYDFAALEDGSLPAFVLDKKVNRLLGYSQTPVVLLTESPEDERAAVAELERRKASLGDRSTVDFVAALDDLVPRQQEEKAEILSSIARTLARVDRAALDAEQQKQFDEFARAVAARPFGRAELPESIRRQFEGTGGKDETGFVLVFPSISLADGQAVRALAEEVRRVPLPSGAQLSASGEPMVLADILEMVTREGPLVLIAALVSVTLAMWVGMGSLLTALICLSPTAVSIVALGGLMALFDMPFNYLNILVVPMLIGVTVDAGVHLMTRLSDESESFAAIYAETGRAIVGGLLTSAIGFGALLLADHPGLASVGRIAVLGLGVNMAVMLVVFPAFLLLRRRGAAARLSLE